jgi:catechol 2,3-dioxygenase-like lactoylglutathione lyase family enzyme
MIDHLGVQVADVAASLDFYLRAFGPIGMREAMRFPDGDTFVVGLGGADGIPCFWLSRAAGSETRELHVAFRAAEPSDARPV